MSLKMIFKKFDAREFFERLKQKSLPLLLKIRSHPKQSALVLIGTLFFICTSLYSHSQEQETHVFHRENRVELEGGQILGQQRSITESKDIITAGKLKIMDTNLKQLMGELSELKNKVTEIQKPSPPALSPGSSPPGANQLPTQPSPNIEVQPATPGLEPSTIIRKPKQFERESIEPGFDEAPRSRQRRRSAVGPTIVSFPIKNAAAKESTGIVIPSGSYLKTKLLTGLRSENRALPALLQADFAFVGPNQTRIDLSGCFLIAKSTGNFMTERIEMQVSKMSCVSKSGKSFERELNGFVVDDKDGSFALEATLNSKQERVASLAFLSAIVEGASKAYQQKHTTTTQNRHGMTTQNTTGEDAEFIAAGGAGQAATLVTQFFLKQSENLLPTLDVNSGANVWVILQDKVDLPSWYFKKAKQEGFFSYLSGVLN